jgi:hypothetical protein
MHCVTALRAEFAVVKCQAEALREWLIHEAMVDCS